VGAPKACLTDAGGSYSTVSRFTSRDRDEDDLGAILDRFETKIDCLGIRVLDLLRRERNEAILMIGRVNERM
jgi:hypothetical protein